MSGTLPDDEQILALRATQLARTRATLPLDATITPRVLAEMDDTALAPPEQPAGDEPAEALALPRISIDTRSELPGPDDAKATMRADYAVVATLGEGGMGRVHLARQRSLDRDVAVKTLKPGAPWKVATALLREAKITGTLEHPGVIPVHALGVDDDGRPMLVMKRVDGVDFATLLRDPAHPAWRTRLRGDDRLAATLEILVQVCRTLEFAHSRGVLHRDVKPENVMVGSFGEVYLLDWGIATKKLEAASGELVGTPLYMAPEMARGGPVDERTDVYLLGAVLHEILTGRARHEGASIVEVLRSALASEPFAYDSMGNADIPPELASLANRATSRDAAGRPSTVEAFREEVADYLRHRTARALSNAALERVRELEELLGATGPELAPQALARAYRLAAEARFGLVQSLQEHATDAHARQAMDRCLRAAIELELRQGHADSAEALLRELASPHADLARRIEQTRERAAATARAQERLQALERDLDPSQHAMRRTGMLIALTVFLVASGRFVPVSPEAAPTRFLELSLLATVVVIGAMVVFRKRLLTNAFNRRISGVLVSTVLAVLTNRAVSVATGTPVVTMLTVDILVSLFVLATGAVTLFAPLGWAAAALAVGLAVAVARPAYTLDAFLWGNLTALLVTAFTLIRMMRSSAKR